MRKTNLIALLLLAAAVPASAQPFPNSVKGTVSDTLAKQQIFKAVVSLVRARDSMLVKFTRTDANGFFEIKDLPPDKYVLLTSFPNYADYTDTFTIGASGFADMGRIPMITKTHLLQEVVVKQTVAAIRLKGDTTEYRADSFHVQANATVEELLKKLPGIQVDKNGQITAQGQKVQKVLVDGEEFFGDDPTLVTQNIRADMVDKVQVYDKKSDQATFTGIDDGEKTKTLNLKLKDDKKKGYFGKLDGGIGTDGFYNGQALLNKFRKKEKMAVFGISSNTGKIGLNWQDQRNFGDNSNDIQFDENGDGYYDGSNRDELEGWGGRYDGQGFPKVQTAGAHYNNKWNDDRQSINGNYKILDLGVTGNSSTNTQYILPDTLYYNNQQQSFVNRILRHKGNLVYDFDMDSTSSLKITVNAGNDHKTTISQFYNEALTADKQPVNQGNRTLSTQADIGSFNSSLLWRKKFKKKGRTITVSARENYNQHEATGFLFADNQFFTAGIPTLNQVTDQYKQSDSRLLSFDSKISYTEPLSPVSSLAISYGIGVNNNNSSRNSFNKAPNGKYESLDTVFSNGYAFNILTQKSGLTYSYIKKKFRLTMGNTVGYTNFTQTDQRTAITGKRNFVNWFPQMSTSYAFTNQHRIGLNYNGSTTQPSLQQLQPLKTNDDPLNIVIGNPALRPSFSNRLSLFYNDFRPISGRSTWLWVSYNTTNNAFTSRDYVDSLGRRVSQSINVDGNYSMDANLSYGLKLFGASVDLEANMNNSRYVNVVNNQQNVTVNRNYGFGMYIGKQVEKVYDNSIQAHATYTTTVSSIQKNAPRNYWTYNIHPDFDFFFPWKLQLHTDLDFAFRQRTSDFDEDLSTVYWNAWFGKKMLKGDALVIKIAANDILDQNIGFRRTSNTNFVTQNTYSTIRRYFMLSAVWSFSKGATPNPQ
ncbi:MAG: outer membrane beta-barrel protein [Chitinophagaceae bacterium]|nr:outer membrane beta-barrel protein [Chitinophagaceae bacterium]